MVKMNITNQIIKWLGGYTKSEMQELVRHYGKHRTLASYRQYLNSILEIKEYKYNYRGTGKKPLHTALDFKKEYYPAYKKFVLGLLKSKEYLSSDNLIFDLNIAINKWINGKYQTDMQAWGKREYWETPIELYRKIVDLKQGLDCDSVMLFKYHCFKVAMQHFKLWEHDKWRLRGFIVDVLGYGLHAMLAWVKKGVNAWIPIESTFYPTQFERVWNENMLFRNNYIYKIIVSFDDTAEYQKRE